jgi:hypothetical protein
MDVGIVAYKRFSFYRNYETFQIFEIEADTKSSAASCESVC